MYYTVCHSIFIIKCDFKLTVICDNNFEQDYGICCDLIEIPNSKTFCHCHKKIN